MRKWIVVVVLSICVMALASESYKSPESGAWEQRNLYLQATSNRPDAVGVILCACNSTAKQHRCQLYAANLPERGRFSVWLTKVDNDQFVTRQRVDPPWEALRSSAEGVLTLKGNLEWCPGYQDRFLVVHHPDGESGPGNTVLEGTILIEKGGPKKGAPGGGE